MAGMAAIVIGFRPAAQANPLIALPQIDLGQIVLVHQLDELADLA